MAKNKEEIRATAMKERKTFWDKNAGRYDCFMRKDRAAYEEMYTLIDRKSTRLNSSHRL